jgi:hypothetical protein
VQASAEALLRALEETGLLLPLPILVAQRQASLVFRNDLTHLKLIGQFYDEVRGRPLPSCQCSLPIKKRSGEGSAN